MSTALPARETTIPELLVHLSGAQQGPPFNIGVILSAGRTMVGVGLYTFSKSLLPRTHAKGLGLNRLPDGESHPPPRDHNGPGLSWLPCGKVRKFCLAGRSASPFCGPRVFATNCESSPGEPGETLEHDSDPLPAQDVRCPPKRENGIRQRLVSDLFAREQNVHSQVHKFQVYSVVIPSSLIRSVSTS